MKQILICFAAGCLGALINSLTVWLFGDYGITMQLGVHIAPALTSAWLYPRIVWGGIWGLLFLFPLLKSRPMTRGMVLSIFPSLVQLLVIFPLKDHKGYLGVELGTLTPLFVIFFNMVWGVVTSLAVKASK